VRPTLAQRRERKNCGAPHNTVKRQTRMGVSHEDTNKDAAALQR
jgi:hypothetical protein